MIKVSKRISFVLVFALVLNMFPSFVSASTPSLNLETIDEVPEGVTPIEVESLEELEEVLKSYDSVFEQSKSLENSTDITFNKDDLTLSDSENDDDMASIMTAFPLQTTTDTEKIFKSSDIGGSIKSKVKYKWYYDDYNNRKYISSISYHDIVLDGIYGAGQWNLYEKSADISSDRSEIDVYVRGRYTLYVYVIGQQIFFKHYDVEESYTID